MSRRECSECGIHTPDFSCKNCGSSRLRFVTPSPAVQGSRLSLLERSHAHRARRDMLAR